MIGEKKKRHKFGQQGNSRKRYCVNAFGSKPLEAKPFEGVVKNNLI